jgi:hypothetical protein
MGLKTWNMSLDKLVNIGPITQPSVGDNLRLFLVLFIAIFNNSSVLFTAVILYWWRKSEWSTRRKPPNDWQTCKACETSTGIHVAVIEVFTK